MKRQRGDSVIPWIVGVLLVFGALIAAAAWWWRANGQQFLNDTRRGAQQTMEQGRNFGASTDYRGCLERATAMAAQCGTFNLFCEVEARVFLQACMQTTKDTATFCASQPPSDEIIASAMSAVQLCQALNRPTERCARVVGEAQKACAAPKAPADQKK